MLSNVLWGTGTVGHLPLDFQKYFPAHFGAAYKFYNSQLTLSGSVFSIALKTCKIGNERRSVTLRKHYNRFRLRSGLSRGPSGRATRDPLICRGGASRFVPPPLAPDPPDDAIASAGILRWRQTSNV